MALVLRLGLETLVHEGARVDMLYADVASNGCRRCFEENDREARLPNL